MTDRGRIEANVSPSTRLALSAFRATRLRAERRTAAALAVRGAPVALIEAEAVRG